ncbi:hypothetical protein F2Q69_00048640 [Brassica cretica]|uniref:Uncharacterized protein n=1 Tax=Brassica cretica TaxID=69181 RepID=A0A8S9Q039_BRACR|nr:hypothetical protein F2Q69_00048640 [Brassica cretica]
MEQASSDESCPSNIHLRNRQRTKDNIRSATVDVDVLDCPVCFEPLTIPIFQCFREPYGVYVTISCIAPSSPEVGNTMTYESPDVKKTLQVNLETPLENSMLIPHCSLSGDLLDLRLCIKKLN